MDEPAQYTRSPVDRARPPPRSQPRPRPRGAAARARAGLRRPAPAASGSARPDAPVISSSASPPALPASTGSGRHRVLVSLTEAGAAALAATTTPSLARRRGCHPRTGWNAAPRAPARTRRIPACRPTSPRPRTWAPGRTPSPSVAHGHRPTRRPRLPRHPQDSMAEGTVARRTAQEERSGAPQGATGDTSRPPTASDLERAAQDRRYRRALEGWLISQIRTQARARRRGRAASHRQTGKQPV
jgi:hypothetical protein